MTGTIVIPAGYNGPDGSGNGGYSCGSVAAVLGGGDLEVRLRQPPPLDVPLTVTETGAGWDVERGPREVVADARRRRVTIEPPQAVTLDAAHRAAEAYPGLAHHAFPRCYVCGTERDDGLGLRPGPVAGRDVFATPWTPRGRGDADLRDVWAALDCPSGWATDQRSHQVVVLGTMCAQVSAPVRAGEPHVVLGWHRGGEGRKHRAGSAVLGADGTVCALAESIWIVVSEAPHEG
jgi:hypothetical protein